MISEGLVKINGVTASLGDSADPETDVIEVGGKRISAQGRKTYIMLNKPRGYITSLSDERGDPVLRSLSRPSESVFTRSVDWICTPKVCS